MFKKKCLDPCMITDQFHFFNIIYIIRTVSIRTKINDRLSHYTFWMYKQSAIILCDYNYFLCVYIKLFISIDEYIIDELIYDEKETVPIFLYNFPSKIYTPSEIYKYMKNKKKVKKNWFYLIPIEKTFNTLLTTSNVDH